MPLGHVYVFFEEMSFRFSVGFFIVLFVLAYMELHELFVNFRD